MTADNLDFSETMVAKSDQLNADNLAGGAITAQITGARVSVRDNQPLTFRLSGGHMPWKPCKGMRRLLAEAAGSTSAKPWVGKWIRLFRDPRVKWAGAATGGIRVSGVDASILQATRSFRVRDGRNSHTDYRVEPISDRQHQGAPTADIRALLSDAGLSVEDLDRWLASEGRPSLAEGTDKSRAALASWLAADHSRLRRISDHQGDLEPDVIDAEAKDVDPAADALAAVRAKLNDWSVDNPREFDDAVPHGFDIEACGLDEGQALLDERER